ncbi:nuclear transport factor 2 family protein [Vibrio cholerae]|uniref:nuclear transport factor 2 family protein n=1 Tax=Vibrio cholerae TaxID=666 RepID=UPI00112517A3|nr:nuclear transport factor 2 family protein [Vibrio cholerae]EKN8282704.1 nuclear transport factor 2 family protein [Vibrio cholerae]ELJ8586887.1 nuclear transport factor 2 family protein [Vibrio cholerae]BCN20946.1 hypothetical protein [Vibrio cholerae]GHW70174.1 hypothetical protein VCSRO58_2822 [Vibrio cholerae]
MTRLLFSQSVSLTDPNTALAGKDSVLNYIGEIFAEDSLLKFEAHNIFVCGKTSIIEFSLTLGTTELVGTDIIDWDENGQIVSLRAYLYQL